MVTQDCDCFLIFLYLKGIFRSGNLVENKMTTFILFLGPWASMSCYSLLEARILRSIASSMFRSLRSNCSRSVPSSTLPSWPSVKLLLLAQSKDPRLPALLPSSLWLLRRQPESSISSSSERSPFKRSSINRSFWMFVFCWRKENKLVSLRNCLEYWEKGLPSWGKSSWLVVAASRWLPFPYRSETFLDATPLRYLLSFWHCDHQRDHTSMRMMTMSVSLDTRDLLASVKGCPGLSLLLGCLSVSWIEIASQPCPHHLLASHRGRRYR